MAALAAAPACGKPAPAHVDLDYARFGAELEQRAGEVAGGKKVSAAMTEMLAALGGDPALAVAGNQLLARLTGDPRVEAAGAAVIEKLTSEPAILAEVNAIMTAHPDATPKEIGELVGARFTQVTDSPVVSAAFQAAFDALLGKLHPRARLKPVLARTSAQLDAYLEDPARQARWAARLRELNGGEPPDAAKATQLYLDHAWSPARMEAFLVKLCASPTVRAEAAQLLAELLSVPALDGKLREVTVEVATDPLLQASATRLLVILVSAPTDDHGAALQAELEQALTAPPVVAGLDKLIDVVFDDPKIGAAVRVHFDKICADPGLRQDFDDLIDHW